MSEPLNPEQVAQTKMNVFHHAVMSKFFRVAKEKNRSLSPWKDYNYYFLLERLQEEWKELQDISLFDPVKQLAHHTVRKEQQQDELIDVAAFCMFLWLKLQGTD